MEKSYNHLKPEERDTVMLMMRDGATLRSVARTLSRAPSTISSELKKNCPVDLQRDVTQGHISLQINKWVHLSFRYVGSMF
jgi:IS30 family transposase